ncbi:MAG: hypothetical protein WCH40_13700 [Verrucomicrobiales bacterium]
MTRTTTTSSPTSTADSTSYNHHRIHQALDYAKPWQLYRPKSGLAEAA